jgi:gluconolactonase
MYAPPPTQLTELHARLPESLRLASRHSQWASDRWVQGGMHSFLEGPPFDRAGRLHPVDIAQGRILRASPDGAAFEVLAHYDGEPNGLKIHRDGSLWIADHRRGILRMDPAGGEPRTICPGPAGGRLHGFNDMVFSRSSDLYFTDQGESDLVRPFGRVWRLRTKGALELLIEGLPSPNGIVLSADERVLMVAVTKANAVWRAPLRPDGTFGRVGIFIQLNGSAGGDPDGLALDEAGNLAVAHPLLGVVWLFSPRGEPLLRIELCAGATTTNFAYGGADRRKLYITKSAIGCVLRCPMPHPGVPLYSHFD